MYNLLSDRLDSFEKEIRRRRNQLFGRLATGFFFLAHFVFNKSRAYVHTDRLKFLKERLAELLIEVDMELELRRKINASGIEQVIRDSSVLTGDALKKPTARSEAPVLAKKPSVTTSATHGKKPSISKMANSTISARQVPTTGLNRGVTGLNQRSQLGKTMNLDAS